MPELWLPQGGVNRKQKALWLPNSGVNQKQKELWVGSGGVNRKIFSGADARISVSCDRQTGTYDTTDLQLNADGSGYINLTTTYSSSSKLFNVAYDIQVDDALTWAVGDYLIRIENVTHYYNGYIPSSGSWRQISVLPGTSGAANNFSSNPYIRLGATVAGTANAWRVTISISIRRDDDGNGRARITWPAGSWSIINKPLNNIDVTYL